MSNGKSIFFFCHPSWPRHCVTNALEKTIQNKNKNQKANKRKKKYGCSFELTRSQKNNSLTAVKRNELTGTYEFQKLFFDMP